MQLPPLNLNNAEFSNPVDINAYRLTYQDDDLESLKAEYLNLDVSKRATSVKQRLIHILIAKDAPIEMIVRFVKNNKGLLSYPDPLNYKFSPVTIAVIYERTPLVELFLSLVKDKIELLQQQDGFGYTPLHHAALLRRNEIQVILNRKMEAAALRALNQIRCQFNGTPENIAEITAFPHFEDQHTIGFFENNPLTAGKFREISGATYTNQIHVLPEILIKSHLQGGIQIAATMRAPEDVQLNLSQCESSIELIREDEAQLSLGIAANQTIPAKSFIALFSGKLLPSEFDTEKEWSKAGVHKADQISALNIGNLIRYTNDGPPNTRWVLTKNYRGLPFAVGVQATREINSGEPIYIDYGHTSVIRQTFYKISPGGIRTLQAFFRDTNLKTAFEAGYKKDLYLWGTVNYTVTTFPVLLQLHLAKTLKIDETLEFFSNPDIQNYYINKLKFKNFAELKLALSETGAFLTKYPDQALNLYDLSHNISIFYVTKLLSDCLNSQSFTNESGEERIHHLIKLGQLLDHADPVSSSTDKRRNGVAQEAPDFAAYAKMPKFLQDYLISYLQALYAEAHQNGRNKNLQVLMRFDRGLKPYLALPPETNK